MAWTELHKGTWRIRYANGDFLRNKHERIVYWVREQTAQDIADRINSDDPEERNPLILVQACILLAYYIHAFEPKKQRSSYIQWIEESPKYLFTQEIGQQIQRAAVPSVTLRDVAQASGVSVGTVWQALIKGQGKMKPETREQIQEVAARLGFRPKVQLPAYSHSS